MATTLNGSHNTMSKTSLRRRKERPCPGVLRFLLLATKRQEGVARQRGRQCRFQGTATQRGRRRRVGPSTHRQRQPTMQQTPRSLKRRRCLGAHCGRCLGGRCGRCLGGRCGRCLGGRCGLGATTYQLRGRARHHVDGGGQVGTCPESTQRRSWR